MIIDFLVRYVGPGDYGNLLSGTAVVDPESPSAKRLHQTAHPDPPKLARVGGSNLGMQPQDATMTDAPVTVRNRCALLGLR